jgi:hypothetical protein
MSSGRKLRIALAPVEIAGYYADLRVGLDELGVDARLLMVEAHSFRYGDRPPDGRFAQGALELARRSDPKKQPGLGRFLVRPANLLSRAALVAHAARHYDVLVLSYGSSLLHLADLPLLKRLGKKLIFIFHGTDSRPPYLNGKKVRAAGDAPGPHLAAEARRMKRTVAWINRYADAVIDNPLSGHFHSRPFVNWFEILIPRIHDSRFARAAEIAKQPRTSQALRVLHAPSDPPSKGSDLIAAAIGRARQRGFAIDFIEIKGRPNAEVLEEIARCDFVIDELYSDVPGASLCFEAAALGKPAVVGGFGAQQFRRWIRDDMVLPTHYCHPDELDAAIDRLASDASYRAERGASALEFVTAKCAPVAVAERVLRVIEGNAPASWFVDPQQISYAHGYGLTDAAARGSVRAVLEAGGDGALQLSDKPALVQSLRAFAGMEPQAT